MKGEESPYAFAGCCTCCRATCWFRDNGLDGIHSQERYWALQIIDNLDEIERWRASLDDAQRRRFNHPQAIWVNWRKTIKTKAPQRQRASRGLQLRKGSNGRPVFFDGEMIRRASVAIRENWCNDTIRLARVALEAAIRDMNDLIALAEPKRPPAKPVPAEAALHA
jgi:hypothetical protein